MARIIKYYAENGVTVIEEGLDSVIIRPSFSYNDVSDIVTIINLDNQAQDWSAESSVFRKKDGSSIGSTKDEIVTYLSENTVFSKGASVPDPSWGSIVGTLSDQTDLQSALDSKQDELVSGTNIKTVNNTSILGSGNIETASVNPTSGILPVNENGVFVDSVVSENSGNVGIGTTTPGNKLSISGPSSNQFEIINSVNSKSWRPNINGNDFYITETGVSNSFVIQAGGNVGIGTTSPSTALHVVGSITVNDGNNNTKVGTNAGLSFTGINQSAFGYNAGLSSSGDNQTVVGYQAGQSNTATSQSAFGRDSGRLNTGINQSAFGRESGSNNTGDNQSVLGSLAGFSNTGANQTAVGREAGRSNTGASQSAFGYNSGRLNTGTNNSVFGYNAGNSNTGANQSAFGGDAGRDNTGNNQSVFGFQAGLNNTATYQSAFGWRAGLNNTGANQTAVGREAGRDNTGDNNSNFGYQSGYYLSNGSTVNTGSSNSVFLGSNTKALGASQTNQIVIGHDATGIGANSVVLGNDSIATTALKGDVGIGTTSPGYKLDVAGDMNVGLDTGFSTNKINFHEGFSYIQASSIFGSGSISMNIGSGEIYLRSDGYVGIDTSSPSEKLDVNGTVKAQGYKSSDGSAGVTQNVNTGGGNTLVIKNGIITQVI